MDTLFLAKRQDLRGALARCLAAERCHVHAKQSMKPEGRRKTMGDRRFRLRRWF
jgi:hypothetical protein